MAELETEIIVKLLNIDIVKRVIYTICAIVVSSFTIISASSVQIGDLYYNINTNDKTAEVTYRSCKGDKYNVGWKITEVTVPTTISYKDISYTVTKIGDNAFCNCKALTTVFIPESVKNVGNFSFMGCDHLVSVTISQGVSRVGIGAFYQCSQLNFISIPSSVRYIEKQAFSGCTQLAYITIYGNILSIENSTFLNCSNLHSIDIPNSVESIGNYAFYNCKSLSTITIPNRVTNVGAYAFSECTSLETIYCSRSLNLTKANLPAEVHIETDASAELQQNNSQPPLLVLQEGSVLFSDNSQNHRIDADEQSSILFSIMNKGKGAARHCEVRVHMTGSANGIACNTLRLPIILPGQKYDVTLPLTSSIDTKDGNVTFAIEVYEPKGWGIAPFELTVATKAYEPPYLQVVDYNVSSTSGKIRKMEPFTIMFNLQNTKYGEAKDVKVSIRYPDNIFIMDGSAEATYSSIKSGEVKPIRVTLAANNNYAVENIPIKIEIKERHGRFGESKDISLALNQSANSSIQIAAIDEPVVERKEIQLAMIKSDVDRNIPTTKNKNNNTFVLIVANEHYLQEASVPFAMNDGNIFKEYCIKTLGIGEKHIKLLTDATGNQIKAGVNWLANLTEAFDNPQIIVYYAGHGIPDEASKSAYLLPVDGSGTDVSTGYKLDELYATLGNMPASRITVFMDACFSGSKREEGMLASARGVALKTKSGVPQGKMVVFSAAQGDETAYPNREQQHGLFTYYLLKKLQETEGNVGLKDLGDYVTKQVTQQSLLLNSKKQTPCVIPSSEVGTDWENWKLK